MKTDSSGQLSLPGKMRMAIEVARTYRRAKDLIRRHDLPTTLVELRAGADSSGGERVSLPDALRLGRAVVRTLAVLPADSRCLMRSLVLTGMLARRGVRGTLVIAVKPGEAFGAHAWVELDGRPLLSPGNGEFARLAEL
jgi:hypothetical protein